MRSPWCCTGWSPWCVLDTLTRCRVTAICDKHDAWIQR